MTRNFLNLLLSIFLLFFVSSCQLSQNKENSTIKEELTPGVDGVRKNYRNDKTLLSTIEYKDGKRHGISRSYYDNGKVVQKEICYNLGRKSGTTNSYYKNGNLYYTVEYVDDKREGVQKKYYESAELMAEVPYKNGLVQPGLIEYQKSGKRKKLYPTIVFEEINKIDIENKYIIRVKLSMHNKSVKFTQIKFNESGDELVEKKLICDHGVAELVYFVRKNTPKVIKVKIRAELKTFLGNTFVTYNEKEVNINF